MDRIRLLAVIGVAMVLLGGGTASADAKDDKSRVDRQLQETEATLEAATDRAKAAAAERQAAQAALPGAEAGLADAKGQVIGAEAAVRQAQRDEDAAGAVVTEADGEYAAARERVDQERADASVFVAAVYKGSGFVMVNSVLESGSPSDLALRIAYLDKIGAESRRAVDAVTAARMAAKQRGAAAELARQRLEAATDAARRRLEESRAAQAAAERAAADVQALLDRSAKAEAAANAEREAVLARYRQLKVDSDRIGAELRAAAAAETRPKTTKSGPAAPPANTAVAPRTGAFFVMPVRGWKSSNFGMRFDPVYKVYQLHAGIDVAAGGGQPIVAAGDGRVVRAGWAGGNGNYTCIHHGTYQGKGLATCYGHQSAILVKVGQQVHRGELIGRVGTTGASTGNHLHFEVRLNGTPVQPLNWLPGCLC
ncbi:peptidoglycan DD-metalloendopeptidase family protein [Dactylosporangium sucinum]|uniref:M23ase beta-sheet core domain-containing protein n=1 Tax=Dactylosporangium sucinum TaxID=1424081 RepID=A0A917TS00_9ACTN|nr:M23 family metallopeptidase [Dactylosporangium sucinum]GGM34776.1 hypothetical protein GCM10007977_040360 [Dactylosporangium sucinum]